MSLNNPQLTMEEAGLVIQSRQKPFSIKGLTVPLRLDLQFEKAE